MFEFWIIIYLFFFFFSIKNIAQKLLYVFSQIYQAELIEYIFLNRKFKISYSFSFTIIIVNNVIFSAYFQPPCTKPNIFQIFIFCC